MVASGWGVKHWLHTKIESFDEHILRSLEMNARYQKGMSGAVRDPVCQGAALVFERLGTCSTGFQAPRARSR